MKNINRCRAALAKTWATMWTLMSKGSPKEKTTQPKTTLKEYARFLAAIGGISLLVIAGVKCKETELTGYWPLVAMLSGLAIWIGAILYLVGVQKERNAERANDAKKPPPQ